MSRFRFRRKTLLMLAVGLLMLRGQPSLASSCGSDPACTRASALAHSATNRTDKLAAIEDLKAAYARLSDPRLPLIIGKHYLQLGQPEQAKAFCLQAQSNKSADGDIRQQAQDCLNRASVDLKSESSKLADPIVNRFEARSGSSHAEATVHNAISFAPQISVAPTIQASPLIQIGELTPKGASLDRHSTYQHWWLWTAIGGGVVAIIAIGLGVGLRSKPELPDIANTYRPIYDY